MIKKNLTILIVEDEHLIALDTAMLLEDHGYKTRIADCGESALEIVNNHADIDLILMDIDLGPGMDGPETAKIILKKHSIPIVFLTSHSEEEMVEKVRTITRYGYVIKNSGDFVLLSSIEMAFELHDAHIKLQKQLCALEESERKHEIFINSIDDFAYLKDESFRYILINDANARFFNRRKREILGKTDFDLLPRQHAEKYRRSDELAIRENKIIISKEEIDGKIYETRNFPVPLARNKMGVGAYIRDITEQTRIENQLKESEEKFRSLAEASPFAIMIYQDNYWVYTNPAGEQISGFSAEELYRQKFWEIVHPDYKSLVKDRGLKRQSGQETTNSYELIIKKKNGSDCWVYLNGRSITYQGKPAGLISIADITDRKTAEEKLKLSEKTYKDIINSISEAVFIQDPEGIILFMNDTVEEMYGYSKKEILGKTHHFLAAPGKNDLKTIDQQIKNAYNGNRERLIFRARKKDGTIFPKEISLSPGTYFGKKVVIAVAWDITERLKQETILKESKSRYKALFNDNNSVMILLDPETGNITNANRAAVAYYGWPIEKLRGMNISEINTLPFEKIKAAMTEAQTGGKKQFVFKHRLANGKIRDVEVYSGPIDIGGKHLLYSIVHDITARKKAQEALREREEYLSITLHSIGDAVIATDIEGNITQMNPVAENLTGWRFDEAKGHPLHTVFHIINVHTRQKVMDPVAIVLKTGKLAGLANHTVLIAKDGKEYHISDSAAPIVDKNGQIRGVILVFSNVTEKYKIREKIRESERMLNTLIGNLPGMVYRCKNKPGWPMEFVSPGSIKLTGYPPEDFYVRSTLYNEIIHPDDRQMVWDDIQKCVREKKHFSIQYRIHDINQKEKWVHEQGQGVFSENGEIIALEGFIRDITSRKKAYIEIENLLKEKEILLREIHHRTKNNMNTLANLLSLQEKQLDDEIAASALRNAQNRIKTMVSIYDKLFKSDNFREISTRFYLDDLIQKVSVSFNEPGKVKIQKHIQDLTLDPNTLFTIGLIINELLTNSYKYAFPEGRQGQITLEFLQKDSNTLALHYSDNGVGFTQKPLQDQTGGFGLKLIYLLTDQLKGSITLHGQGGTQCIITFPMK
ncbi:MAG: PAS domain S-box protein [Candidatus Marinimicrobia bacterium]|nr:PAS domain S-box protein [Candidatus Neomarinimicrobiota bacterium]